MDAGEQPVTQYTYNSSLIDFKWRIIQNGDGTVRIMPAISNSRALDVYGGVTKTSTFNGRSFPKRDGIDCQIVDYNGNSHQKWVLTNVANTLTTIGISDEGHDHSSYMSSIQGVIGNKFMPWRKKMDVDVVTGWSMMMTSGAYIFRGHGNKTQALYSNGALDRSVVLEQPSTSLNNCKLVLYMSCSTAEGGLYGANLAQATSTRGAKTVIGFSDIIYCNQANTWVYGFCKAAFQDGKTIQESCIAADSYTRSRHLFDVGNTDKWIIFGSSTQKLI